MHAGNIKISKMNTNKGDNITAMMQLLLKLDKKLDEQKIDSDVQYTNLMNKFDVRLDNFDKILNEQKNEIKNSFEVNCDELKNEIKRQYFMLDKRIDEMHTHFDKLTEQTVTLVCLLYTSNVSMTNDNCRTFKQN